MHTAISEREMPPFTAPGETSSETAAVPPPYLHSSWIIK